jgi:Uncharacterized protein conserved in bacteria
MKLLFWIFSLSITSLTNPPVEGTLLITVENVKVNQGEIMLAIYSDDQEFLSETTYRSIHHEVNEFDSTMVEVTDLPFGTYAISIYHDENNNGKLDTNFMKIPKEPYGFSNNARGMFGPPKVNEAQFSFFTMEQEIKIEIK